MDFLWGLHVVIVLMAVLENFHCESSESLSNVRAVNETENVNTTVLSERPRNNETTNTHASISLMTPANNYSTNESVTVNNSLPLTNQSIAVTNNQTENNTTPSTFRKSSLLNDTIQDSNINESKSLDNSSLASASEKQDASLGSATISNTTTYNHSFETPLANSAVNLQNTTFLSGTQASSIVRNDISNSSSNTTKSNNEAEENLKANSTEIPSGNLTFSLVPSSITYSRQDTTDKGNSTGSSLLNSNGNYSLAAIPSNITFSVVPSNKNNEENNMKNDSDSSTGNSLLSLTIPTDKVYAAVPSNITFSTIPQSVASDIAAIDIKSKTSTLESELAENITHALNETDCNTTTTSSPPTTTQAKTTTSETTTTSTKQADDGSRSEIYKMHNNGLMLLHAQSARFASEAKKSELLDKSDSGSINYHVRKRTNGTKNEYNEEKQDTLVSALAHIPGVLRKRTTNLESDDSQELRRRRRSIFLYPTTSVTKKSKFFINPSPVPFIPEVRKPCSNNNKRNKDCSKISKSKHYNSVVQGENSSGSKRKKRTILPKSVASTKKILSSSVTDDGVMYERTYSIIKVGSEKHKRLKRALKMMSLPMEHKYGQRSHAVRRRSTRDKDIQKRTFEKIPAIPNIPKLKDNIMGEENTPFDGELRLEQFHRLPTAGMEAYASIPPIQRIEDVGKVQSEFIHVTAAPDIKDIKDIEFIKEIPTMKPMSFFPEKSGQEVSEKIPMPVKDTIKTKYGLVTRVTI